MKLKEITDKIFENGPNSLGEYSITGKELSTFMKEIKQCDEFKNCIDIHLIEGPTHYNEIVKTGKSTQCQKIGPLTDLKGICYLYQICLTPIIYNPNKILGESNGLGCITPIFYDPNKVTPTKRIILEYSPECRQGLTILEDEKGLKQMLHDNLDVILNDPKKFQVEGDREILIRAYFLNIS